jgi:hypothetical protein
MYVCTANGEKDPVKIAENKAANHKLKIALQFASDHDRSTYQIMRSPHNIRGPEYAKNSCAFDTKSMELSQMYHQMTDIEKSMFCVGLPILGAINKELHRVLSSSLNDVGSQIVGLKASKKKIQELYFFGGSSWKFNTFTSLDTLIEDMANVGGPRKGPLLSPDEFANEAKNRQDLMVLLFKTIGRCEKAECLLQKQSLPGTVGQDNQRSNIFLAQHFDHKSIQESIDHYFELDRRSYYCQFCKELDTRIITTVKHPLLLHFAIPTSFIGTVSTEISVLEKKYNLLSVEYGNMSHYKCRFKRDDKVYAYDGMVLDGECRLVTSTPSFPPMLHNMYRAAGAWYKRDD